MQFMILKLILISCAADSHIQRKVKDIVFFLQKSVSFMGLS